MLDTVAAFERHLVARENEYIKSVGSIIVVIIEIGARCGGSTKE